MSSLIRELSGRMWVVERTSETLTSQRHTFVFTVRTTSNENQGKPHRIEESEVYTIFLISAKIIDCGYAIELNKGSNEHPESMFTA